MSGYGMGAYGYDPSAYQYQQYGQYGAASQGGYGQPQQAGLPQSTGQQPRPGSTVRVVYDYVATEPGAVSLRAGEVCTLLEIKDAGWCTLRTNTDKEGYFPLGYLEEISPPGVPIQSYASQTGVGVAAAGGNQRCALHGKNRSVSNLNAEPDPATGGMTTRYVCKPGCECKGALLPGMGPSSMMTPGMSQFGGHSQGGQYNSAAAAALAASSGASGAAASSIGPQATPLAIAAPETVEDKYDKDGVKKSKTERLRCISDFKLESEGTLSLREGVVCDVVERGAAGGWCVLKAPTGKQGYFPSSHVAECHLVSDGVKDKAKDKLELPGTLP
eukprot:CAMPEP_0173439396 /NCGR_PEP_ID=MMETSP1357-20121228/20931_1 /TAXON_ID=77926 /ORGANISM="Hemiselmis rufescens, Strain PCC563" /LENGTH=329 /DNA_ID=CAMNT_0014404761 /DNA_START=51 /DNA_END=1037 /DNA_ORIENTATION=-